MDFYRRLVDSLLEAGITPFITLEHWDLPQALEDEGGWTVRSTAEAFVEYTDILTRSVGDRVQHWITHNEPAVTAWLGYLLGTHAPGLKDHSLSLRAAHHLLLSHGWAMPVIRRNSPGCEAGITLNISWPSAASNSAADLDTARRVDGMWFRWFSDPLYGRGYPADILQDFQQAGVQDLSFIRPGDLQTIATPTDFIGLNYYTRIVHRADTPENDPQIVFPAEKNDINYTEMDWEIYPDGLKGILCRIYFNYQPLKIYITENGASFSDGPDASGRVADARRTAYLRDHFRAMWQAMQAGVPLAGYFVWSLLDNFEWSKGYSQRFGIIWVDYQSQQRILKDSARWYRQVIAANGLTEVE